MIDTNAGELAVITASSVGLVVQLAILRDTLLDRAALAGHKNGRRQLNRLHISTALGLAFAHSVLLYYGLRLAYTLDPPAWPLELVLNFLLFVCLALVLLLVGLNDLRVRHTLRND